jgi:Mg/Co/Ni transporter MgtE
MQLRDIPVQTKVAKAGMTVREVFRECLSANVPALPYCDEQGRIIGRTTLKNVIQQSIIPDYMAEFAHVVPPDLDSLKEAETRLREVFDNDIAPYAQEPHASVKPDTSLGKVLAIMERHDTSYVFVVHGGRYRGTLTIQAIARYEMELDESGRR